MTAIISTVLFLFFFAAYKKYKPRIEYIEESEMWIMHYSVGVERKFVILWWK